MAHLLQEGEETIFSELKDSGYYVWMNARNDFIAAQEEGALERHASEIFYGGNVPKAKGPIDGERGPGSADFRAMYGPPATSSQKR